MKKKSFEDQLMLTPNILNIISYLIQTAPLFLLWLSIMFLLRFYHFYMDP